MTTTTIGTTRRGRRARREERGVAMLLAMCAVATCSIAAASYIASRESAPDIGANAVNAISAKWAGESAGDLAVAALETGLELADLSDPSQLVGSLTLAGADVSVAVTDAAGDPPAEDATEVVVTITASKGGVVTKSQRIIERTPPGMPFSEAIDPEMGEFAIYAKSSLRLDAGAVVAPWPKSPNIAVGDTIAVGVGFTSDSDFSISGSAILASSKLYVEMAANSTLKGQVANAKFAGGAVLPVSIPVVRAATPTAASGLLTRALGSLLAILSTVLQSGRYQDYTVDNGVVVTLTSGAYSFGDLTIKRQGVLLIDGDVTVVVRDDLEITDRGAVEFANNASSVTFLVADDVLVDNTAIGVSRTIARNASRSGGSVDVYQSPRRLRIIALNGASGADNIQGVTLSNKAIVLGTIFNPYGPVDVNAGCTVFGQIIASQCRLYAGGALLYDTSMNKGFGFTNLTGPLYTSDLQPATNLTTTLAKITEASTDLFSMKDKLDTAAEEAKDGEVAGGDEVTPRTPNSAKDRKWPTLAMALESTVATGTSSDGMLVSVGDASMLESGDSADVVEK